MGWLSKGLLFAVSAVTVIAFAGCSKSGGGGGSADEAAPKNKEEAIAKLSPEYQRAFDAWKDRVAKSCNAAQAFGINQDSETNVEGIDTGALIRRNGNSLRFVGNDSMALVTSFNSLPGTSKTQASESFSINGKTTSVKAETNREGSRCSVFLFGQKVYETYVAESIVLGAHWAAGKEAKTKLRNPKINPLGAKGHSEETQNGAYSILSQALEPNQGAFEFVAQKIGLDKDKAAKYIKPSSGFGVNAAVRIANDDSAVWTEPSSLIARGSSLLSAFSGAGRTLPLEVRIAVPVTTVGETKNSADGGTLNLFAHVLITGQDSELRYSVEKLQVKGLSAFDKGEALQCVKDRAEAYRGGSYGANQLVPSVYQLLSPCSVFFEDVGEAAYETGFFKTLVPEIFGGISPSRNLQYGGWDGVLGRLAREAFAAGKDLRTDLDPSSKTRIVGIVADHFQAVEQGMSQAKNLGLVKDSLLNMGLDWSFSGQTVSSTRVSQILQAIDNSVDTFKVSSERLIGELAQQANSNDNQLAFAAGLDSAYKAEALKALALAKDLSYVDFERDVFSTVLQKMTKLDELRDWTGRFSAIKVEINKYPGLGAIRGDVVRLSLKWLKTGEMAAPELGSVYSALNNSAVPFEASTRTLTGDLEKSLAANRGALSFAASLNDEYKQLALAIRNNSAAAGYESRGQEFFNTVLQKQPSLVELRALNETWTAALQFVGREKARTKDDFASSNERNMKQVLDTAVREAWSTAEFTGLEVLSEVARSKNTCDYYKGASALADCAGLRLFSKDKGMFFDPAFEGRYVTFARDFAGYMSRLNGFDWTSLKWELIGEFFGMSKPMWSKCDKSAFKQKAGTLNSQLNAILREGDQFKKWELERQIKETLRDCQ